jgi:hypothetical protein
MAWTTTKTGQYSLGNHYVQLWKLEADAGTLELSTGLSYIDHIAFCARSLTSSIPNVKGNVLSAGTASNGNVAITGCTAGDDMYVTVWGH